MAPVLKTGRAQALVGSNPTPSAIIQTSIVAEWWLQLTGSNPGDSNAVRLVRRVKRQG